MKKTMKKVVAVALILTSTIAFTPKVSVDAATKDQKWHFDTLSQLDYDYTGYDVTGDGKEDTIKFSVVQSEDYNTPNKVLIYVNGKKAFSKDASCTTTCLTTVIPYDNQYFFFTRAICEEDVDGDMDDFITCWKDGKLVQVADPMDDLNNIGYDLTMKVRNVYEGKINLEYSVQNMAIGWITGEREYAIDKQSLKIVSYKNYISPSYWRVSSGSSLPYVYSDSFVAAKNIKVYKKVDKKKVAFTLKKGQKIKIYQIYVKNGKVMLYGKKGSKKGWLESKDFIFKDVAFSD